MVSLGALSAFCGCCAARLLSGAFLIATYCFSANGKGAKGELLFARSSCGCGGWRDCRSSAPKAWDAAGIRAGVLAAWRAVNPS